MCLAGKEKNVCKLSYPKIPTWGPNIHLGTFMIKTVIHETGLKIQLNLNFPRQEEGTFVGILLRIHTLNIYTVQTRKDFLNQVN